MFNLTYLWKDKYNQLLNLKKHFKNSFLDKFSLLVLSFFILSNYKAYEKPRFVPNYGQFKKNIVFKLEHNAGNIYFEKNKVKFDLFERGKINAIRHKDTSFENILGHVYESNFIGCNENLKIIGNEKLDAFYNYFVGADSTKWKSNVPIYNKLKYQNIYDKIDLSYYSHGGKLKYDFIVHPGGKTNSIKIRYQGLENIYIKSGHLILETALGDIIEQAPLSYQIIKGVKKKIKCAFHLEGDELSFEILDRYNKNYQLIIDPILIFSTFSGSSANNWGQTATYDNSGNLYAGSISFGQGYPTTLGPYQAFYLGGPGNWGTDICISKFNSSGTNLIYSTYLGGTGNENPHSLVVNENNELFVFGSTGSNDFPTTLGCYDNTFNGGTNWAFLGIIEYPSGIDAFVTKFTSLGNSLIGSTYIGGTGNDGVNLTGLVANYADDYRGEIIIDSLDNCWIASSTSSTDFPMVNAVQSSNNGNQDAVVFKFNNALTNLEWSTYFGGTGNEAGYSIQLDNQNQPIITGGTENSALPTTNNVIHSVSPGGIDGFLTKYNINSGTIQHCTYIGTSAYDQAYFVQLDDQDNIYLFGQTGGNYPVLGASIYSNSSSTQFIHKLSPSMDTTIFSTVFGSGNFQVNISPSAFLVSNCGLIYISGWGGTVNQTGNTNNMPITTNAFQSTTDGSDFYLAVFDNNAQSILYATYFGGNQSSEHVDGGTSRFDKNGKIYQAVCAGCFNNSDFPTSPGAYSSVNNNSCNLGVFKFTFESIIPSISIPQSFVCLPNSFQFTNQSEGGNLYSWDFGDGLTSNLFSPSHNYADTGIYDVTLIVSDSMSCIDSDTAILQVQVYALNNASIVGNDTICLGDSTLLTGYGGTDYSWSPSTFLNNSYTQQVYANPTSNIDYTLIATDSCGVDTAYFDVNVPYPIVDAGTDFSMNLGESKTLNGFTNTNNYFWESSSWLSCFNCLNPQINPTQTTLYILNVTDSSGCINSDTVEVTIRSSIFVPNTFTPNGDLKNDEFEIIGENIKSFELWIYNRWGEEIYHATEINNFWNGRYLGNKCKIDSYIWVIEYSDFDNTFKSIKGHINLLK